MFSLISCSDDKKPSAQPTPIQPKDYGTQYNEDLTKIENFLKTHSITVIDHAGFADDQDASFATVPNLDSNSIWGSNTTTPKASLLFKLVNVAGVSHKVYYIKFRNGIGASPTINNQIRTVYNGFLMNETITSFDKSDEKGAVFTLNGLITGWREILPEFKMGTFTGTNQYTDFGAGVMFLPSALAYYNSDRPQIPAYSTLIFTFKLYNII